LYSKVDFRPSDDISFVDEELVGKDNIDIDVIQPEETVNNVETAKFNTFNSTD